MPAIDLKIVFLILDTFAFINYPSKMLLKGCYRPFCKFANQKSNFKISKNSWLKKGSLIKRLIVQKKIVKKIFLIPRNAITANFDVILKNIIFWNFFCIILGLKVILFVIGKLLVDFNPLLKSCVRPCYVLTFMGLLQSNNRERRIYNLIKGIRSL